MTKKKRPAISRAPRWLRGAVVALNIFRASRKHEPEPEEVAPTDEMDPSYEAMLVMPEDELLAAFRADAGYENLVEDAAAERDLKSSGFDGEGEGFQLAQALDLLCYPMGVMEGNVRPVRAAQLNAKLLRRAEAEVFTDWSARPGAYAHVTMKRIAVLGRNLRGQT